jgi:hypothetical protein
MENSSYIDLYQSYDMYQLNDGNQVYDLLIGNDHDEILRLFTIIDKHAFRILASSEKLAYFKYDTRFISEFENNLFQGVSPHVTEIHLPHYEDIDVSAIVEANPNCKVNILDSLM